MAKDSVGGKDIRSGRGGGEWCYGWDQKYDGFEVSVMTVYAGRES